MYEYEDVAKAFVDVAHRIVWAVVATADARGRPWTRVLHPIWIGDDEGTITGWIGTSPTAVKRSHLDASPFASVTYWDQSHDVATADCHAKLLTDDDSRTMVWNAFEEAPPPLGYDPRIIEPWTHPTADAFAVIELIPYRLRVMPGTLASEGVGEVLQWRFPDSE